MAYWIDEGGTAVSIGYFKRLRGGQVVVFGFVRRKHQILSSPVGDVTWLKFEGNNKTNAQVSATTPQQKESHSTITGVVDPDSSAEIV